MKYKIAAVGLIAFINYQILINELGISTLILTILSSVFLLLSLFNKSKKVILALFIIFLIFTSQALSNQWDRSFTNKSNYEINIIDVRRSYFVESFGKLYSNRIGMAYFDKIRPMLTKYTSNMFSHLNLNSLFKVENLVSVILAPFLLIGLVELTKIQNKTVAYYFFATLLLSGFLVPEGIFGRALFIPVINVLIVLGLFKITTLIKNEKNSF